MTATLVLNATYEPLNSVSWRRAVILVLDGRAEVVEESTEVWHSRAVQLRVPLVIRLYRYVRVPYRATAALSRRAVLARDGHECAYCGGRATTLDHVVPRSRGGDNSFDNLVAACGRCNQRKADRTPIEAKMPLRFQPYTPAGYEALSLALGAGDASWDTWLKRA